MSYPQWGQPPAGHPPYARPGKWYTRPAAIVLGLIIFPPFGIFALWKSDWDRRAKWILTVVAAIWFFVIPASSGDSSANSEDTPKPATSSSAPAEPSPSPTEAAEPTDEASPEPTPTRDTSSPTPEPEASDDADGSTGSGGGDNVYYANCDAARAADAAPIHRNDPGYRKALDRDGDGIACDR